MKHPVIMLLIALMLAAIVAVHMHLQTRMACFGQSDVSPAECVRIER